MWLGRNYLRCPPTYMYLAFDHLQQIKWGRNRIPHFREIWELNKSQFHWKVHTRRRNIVCVLTDLRMSCKCWLCLFHCILYNRFLASNPSKLAGRLLWKVEFRQENGFDVPPDLLPKISSTFSSLFNECETWGFRHIGNWTSWSRFVKADRLGHVSRRGSWIRART
jgi:hypothetical protein